MLNFLKAAPLAGYRTYVLGGLVALQAIASFLLGDITLIEFMEQLPEILAGFGIMTLRAAIPEGDAAEDE